MAETVVLDSTNLAAIIADATGEPLEPPKAEATPDPKAEEPKKEDEDGLTEDERRELTQKMQRAVGKRHRQMREAQEESARERSERLSAERRAEDAERELAALRTPKAAEAPKEPQRADFASDELYHDALFDFRVDQRVEAQLARDREAAEKRARESEMERIRAQASERMSRALELVPDYREVTEAADAIVPPHIAGYMQESDMLAELGYHFAKHPEVLERLSALRPDRSLVELGKIEDKLQPFEKAQAASKVQPKNGDKPSTTDDSPSPPRVSAPVIRPLTARGASQVEKPESEMDASEVRKAWERRNGASLSRRQRH